MIAILRTSSLSISHFIIPFSSKLPLLITTFYYIILLVKDNKKVGYGMEKPKSKGIFWVLSIIAVIFLVLLVSALGGSIPMMILTFILFIATFGAGFTLKKKYRENNWL